MDNGKELIDMVCHSYESPPLPDEVVVADSEAYNARIQTSSSTGSGDKGAAGGGKAAKDDQDSDDDDDEGPEIYNFSEWR
jgi:hypothetical protein